MYYKIFSQLSFKDFSNIYGVGKKTAKLLENIAQNKYASSTKEIHDSLRYYNKNNNKNIRYNFINNDIIKMKDGNCYKLIYFK
jgi:hypothetical protein